MRDLESPHGRPGVFGVEERFGAALGREVVEGGAGLLACCRQGDPSGIGHISLGAIRHDAVVDQGIQGVGRGRPPDRKPHQGTAQAARSAAQIAAFKSTNGLISSPLGRPGKQERKSHCTRKQERVQNAKKQKRRGKRAKRRVVDMGCR